MVYAIYVYPRKIVEIKNIEKYVFTHFTHFFDEKSHTAWDYIEKFRLFWTKNTFTHIFWKIWKNWNIEHRTQPTVTDRTQKMVKSFTYLDVSLFKNTQNQNGIELAWVILISESEWIIWTFKHFGWPLKASWVYSERRLIVKIRI